MAITSKLRCRSVKARYVGALKGRSKVKPGKDTCNEIIRLPFGNGRGRSKTAFTTEKIAVFAPIPKATVKTDTTANPRFFARFLNPNRKSCQNEFIAPPSRN